MRGLKHTLLALVFATILAPIGSAFAQSHSSHNSLSDNHLYHNSGEGLTTPEQTEQITFHFRHDSSRLDSLYADNASSYARLRTALARGGISRIDIQGAASPVGNEKYNNRLALRRAEATRKLIEQLDPEGSIAISTNEIGEDWESFTRHIEEHYQRHNRSSVLEILRSDYSNSEKKRRLRRLEYDHTTWRYLTHYHMASSRHTVSVVVYIARFAEEALPLPEISALENPALEITPLAFEELDLTQPSTTPQTAVDSATADQTALVQSKTAQDFDRKMVVAVRTNLLVPVLNVGVEVPIGEHWSAGAEYYYPWIWPAPDNRNCFELLAWNIEGRYWFGKERTAAQRLQGHAVGVYAGGGYYDVQRNFKGHQGEFADVGIDYTYALPVAKGKLHFEFSVGVGYIYSQARPYKAASKGGELLWDKQLQKIHYFGPTRLNVALTVPIFKRIKREGGNE